MIDWKPIKDAPDDGRTLLGYFPQNPVKIQQMFYSAHLARPFNEYRLKEGTGIEKNHNWICGVMGGDGHDSAWSVTLPTHYAEVNTP